MGRKSDTQRVVRLARELAEVRAELERVRSAFATAKQRLDQEYDRGFEDGRVFQQDEMAL